MNTPAKITARLLRNANSNVFILVRQGDDANEYLTMGKGVIEVVSLPHTDVADLTVVKQSFPKAIATFSKSVLLKTPQAMRCLAAASLNPELRDFMTGNEEPQKVTKRAAKKAAKKAKVDLTGMVTVASLARELGINPREARAKMRKAMTKPAAGWVFEEARREEIVAVLQGGDREVEPTTEPKAMTKKAPVTKRAGAGAGKLTSKRVVKKAA